MFRKGAREESKGGEASPSAPLPTFDHPAFALEEGDRLVRRGEAEKNYKKKQGGKNDSPAATAAAAARAAAAAVSHDEYEGVVEALATYLRAYLQARFDLVQQWIPADESATADAADAGAAAAAARCDILASRNWDTAPTLLVVLQNHVGSQLGMWSRSTCLSRGLQAGSMVPFLERAHAQGYAVIVCNPNLNSVSVPRADGRGHRKVPIQESSFPEEHAMYVYENFVAQAKARHVLLFGYGNGAILCKEMLQRQIVRCQQQQGEANRIAGIATVEASVMIQEDDSADVKTFVGRYAVDWEASPDLPLGAAIGRTRAQLGVSQALSVGSTVPEEEAMHHPSTAWSVAAGLDSVFRYFDFCLQREAARAATASAAATAPSPASSPTLTRVNSGGNGSGSEARPSEDRGYLFALEEAARLGLAAAPSSPRPLGRPPSASPASPGRAGADAGAGRLLLQRLQRMVSSGLSLSRSNSSSPRGGPPGSPGAGGGDLSRASSSSDEGGGGGGCRTVALTEKLGVKDFDLLKVVGKGAFGKVMLVRKKTGSGAGKVYAMKVLNKATIVKKGQIQHTMSERAILCEIRHPFIVRLRFAFQSEASLYLITDFYTGGSLFYHLRKSQAFPEARAKFYAAELLLALDHLHRQFIIYRDLKLENVLMDSEGHVALTDFGLSKQNVKSQACATTFCGTAEYLAPELLLGKAYGAAVDWWSFGVLLYEMMDGRTPFYNKNRKYMFHCIVHVRPTFPPSFSRAAQHLILRLLEPDPSRRMGSGERGAREIMEHEFFSDVDFDRLYRRKATPPFNPRVRGEADVKFVPSTYQKMPPKESIGEATTGAGKCADQAFDKFTYHGESHLTS